MNCIVISIAVSVQMFYHILLGLNDTSDEGAVARLEPRVEVCLMLVWLECEFFLLI